MPTGRLPFPHRCRRPEISMLPHAHALRGLACAPFPAPTPPSPPWLHLPAEWSDPQRGAEVRAPHTERLERPQLVWRKGRLAPEQIGSTGLTYEDLVNVNQNDPCPSQYTSGERFLKKQGTPRYLIVASPRV